MEYYQEKHSKTKVRFYADLPLPAALIRVSRNSAFFTWYREGDPLQMEILVINVNVSYRKVTSAWFSELLPCLLFLKNHQPKITLMPKRCIWSGIFCSYSVFFFTFVDLCLFWSIYCSCVSISGTSRDRQMCWVCCWIKSLLSLQATAILPFLGFLDSVLEAVRAILFSWNILLYSLWIILFIC